MNDIRISNSIYISAAALGSVIITVQNFQSYIAWMFPLALILIPVYRTVKEEFQKEKKQNIE